VQSFENTFIKALMNLICITLEMSDTKNLYNIWLNRLERYVQYLIIISEKWTFKNDQYFATVQEKITETVSFAFAFLFHEINNAGTPKAQHSQSNIAS
jgi:hypothetical protein